MAAKEHFAVDRVLKDLIQSPQSTLLEQLTGGIPVREFLNGELPKVMERRADLVARLIDGSIFHLEIQGQNDRQIAYRQGVYCLLIAQRYQRPVRQVVLYVGKAQLRMKAMLDAGGTRVSYRLIDIRELDSDTLLRSGHPADLVLAMLARGGEDRLHEIILRAAALEGSARMHVITQLTLLAGLRNLSESLRMEVKTMGSVIINIRENAILRDIWDTVMAEGKAEDKAEGKAEGEVIGKAQALHDMLKAKFGRVPKWADTRLRTADRSQIDRWIKQSITAKKLEDVIPKA